MHDNLYGSSLTSKTAEVFYDLCVIRLAAGDKKKDLQALEKALQWNPKLRTRPKMTTI